MNLKSISKICSLILLIGCSQTNKKPAEYVDPFIGTDFHGHTYPGATTPFGAVQLSPDTRRGNWDACAGYHYSDSTIIGFSHTHLSGTGCVDLGDILFHPTISEITPNTAGYPFNFLSFSHKNETAKPGYYSVKLDNGISAELTATQHTGIHRYHFPSSGDPKIVIDLAHTLENEQIDSAYIRIVSPTEIEGMRITTGWVPQQHVYFSAKFSEPFDSASLIQNGHIINTEVCQNGNIQAILSFNQLKGKSVTAIVGISAVSIDNARLNMNTETSDFNFDQYKQNAARQWDDKLSTITVEGNNEDQKKIFYTALYHSSIIPNTMSDVNGDYRANNNTIKKSNGSHYSTLSLWDTFRAWHPLMTLTDTSLVNDMVNSMLSMYDSTGELPIWPLSSGETGTMIGYHSVSVITDAYMKGIRGFDAQKALDAMKKSSWVTRKATDVYAKNGYIPANLKKESISCLLEYAYDDWCIAQFAQALGDSVTSREYTQRALSYINVFDSSTGFFRPKNADGSWETPFNSFEVGRAYTEATAWQYRFFVPHDIRGLEYLFGSANAFEQAIDSLFTTESRIDGNMPDITGLIGQYAHGNEPSHHIAYLYNYIGKPWKTQELIRRVQNEMYKSTPDGIVGNEDCGQMSAWFIQSALGFYSVCPGSGEYIFNTPLFEHAKIKLANGNILNIIANNPDKNTYIAEVILNGMPIQSNYITHEQLMQGGTLEFRLSPEPSKTRGTDKKDYPYSLSTEPVVSIPNIAKNLALFVDSIRFEITSATPDAFIHYTLDGSEPDEKSAIYESPVLLLNSKTVKAKAYKTGMKPSKTLSVNAAKAVYKNSIRLNPTQNGASYTYFEGYFQKTDDLNKAKVISSGTVKEINLDKKVKEDHFGFIFKAYIYVPQDAVYEFYTKSDDGSVLYIDNEKVVDNDLSHSAIIATGRIALKAGYHPVTLYYFEDYEGDHLSWGWRNPQTGSQETFPAEQLFVR